MAEADALKAVSPTVAVIQFGCGAHQEPGAAAHQLVRRTAIEKFCMHGRNLKRCATVPALCIMDVHQHVFSGVVLLCGRHLTRNASPMARTGSLYVIHTAVPQGIYAGAGLQQQQMPCFRCIDSHKSGNKYAMAFINSRCHLLLIKNYYQ